MEWHGGVQHRTLNYTALSDSDKIKYGTVCFEAFPNGDPEVFVGI